MSVQLSRTLVNRLVFGCNEYEHSLIVATEHSLRVRGGAAKISSGRAFLRNTISQKHYFTRETSGQVPEQMCCN